MTRYFRPSLEMPEIYLYQQPVDFRKVAVGLAAIVEQELGRNPFDGTLYAFTNRRYNKIKCVFWEDNGFVLYYKALAEEKFRWPKGKPLIALDGKVQRGAYRGNPQSALQLVTAYDTENGLVLSQKATATKTSEIMTVRDMLSVLNIQGAVVTVDALHCQRETLEQISEQKGHVVVQVKGNQRKLKKAIEQQFDEYFKKPKVTPVIELKEKRHGRTEERNVFQLKAKFPPEFSEKWLAFFKVVGSFSLVAPLPNLSEFR